MIAFGIHLARSVSSRMIAFDRVCSNLNPVFRASSKIDLFHRILMSSSILFACTKQDAVQSKSIYMRIFLFFVHGIHRREEYRLSVAEKICPPATNPEFVMECKLIAHPM